MSISGWLWDDEKRKQLIRYAEKLVEYKLVPLQNTGVDLLYAETTLENVTDLMFVADYIRQECGRVVVLVSYDECAHLVITKSRDIDYLSSKKIIDKVAQSYFTAGFGDEHFAGLTHNWHDTLPEMLDIAVEIIITKTLA